MDLTRRSFLKYSSVILLSPVSAAQQYIREVLPERMGQQSLQEVRKFRKAFPEYMIQAMDMDDFGIDRQKLDELTEKSYEFNPGLLTPYDELLNIYLHSSLLQLKNHGHIICRPKKGESLEDYTGRVVSMGTGNYFRQFGLIPEVDDTMPTEKQLKKLRHSKDADTNLNTIYQAIQHMKQEGIVFLEVVDSIKYHGSLDSLSGRLLIVRSDQINYPDSKLETIARKYLDYIVFSPNIFHATQSDDMLLGYPLCNSNIIVNTAIGRPMYTIMHESEHLRYRYMSIPTLIDEMFAFYSQAHLAKRLGQNTDAARHVDTAIALWQARYGDLFMDVYPYESAGSGAFLEAMKPEHIRKAYALVRQSPDSLLVPLYCAYIASDTGASVEDRKNILDAHCADKRYRQDALAALEWLNVKPKN